MIALLATDCFVFTLQIGDGDALYIGADAAADWLIQPDYQAGNETYSLCLEHCWQYVKTSIRPLLPADDGSSAMMFLLSTDGYANSFSDSSGFLKAGSDIYKLWRDNGADFIAEHLEDWLNHSSSNGSGDDISMTLVFPAQRVHTR